jgi:adenylate cyclase
MPRFPGIGFGTEPYPETVARRLRAVNIAAWTAAAVAAFFAALRLLNPAPGMRPRGVVNAAAALAFAALPLLHRVSPVAAPLVLVALAYAFVFRVVAQGGTAGGAYLYYLTATALAVLLLGTERTLLTAGLGALAAGLIIVVHLVVPPSTGLLPPSSLRVNFVTNVVVNAALLFAVVHYAVRQMARAEAALEREFARSEALLANILPTAVVRRLKERPGALIADRYDEASVLLADLAGFTARASETAPEDLVQFLNRVFTCFDQLVQSHGLEKIKTTGDAYMVVSGVPTPRADHAQALARLALAMRDAALGLQDPRGQRVPLRIGLATGPVVAGVVGTRKFFYDVWGDAVNVAARMESTGVPGRIQVAPDTRERLKQDFVLEERGPIEVKGKGVMQTWFLVASRPPRDEGRPARCG